MLEDPHRTTSGRARAQAFLDRKIDVPEEHFDRLASPVASVAVITTVDENGRVNAAPVATCLRNNHVPTCFEFTMDARKHTSINVLSTGEFVINIVPFDRAVLEKVQVTSLSFPAWRERDRHGQAHGDSIKGRQATAYRRMPQSLRVQSGMDQTVARFAPDDRRAGACGFGQRGCLDEQGFVIHQKMRTAQHCGGVYGGKFLGTSEVMDIDMIWDGPDPKTYSG